MTVITMSTVGYTEVRELSETGMIFTSFLIIFSFGIFAYVITTITQYVLDGEFRKRYKNYKMNRRLEKLHRHVIVCGYGRNGKQAMLELIDHDEEVVIIERDDNLTTESENSKQFIFITGDATDEEILIKAKIDEAKAIITTLPHDADNLFITITARQLNPQITIISRASEDHSDVKLKRAGATNVIMPDKIGGIRMAKLVAQPDIVEFVESILLRSGDVRLVEISCSDELDSCYLNHTISELDIRRVSGANLIGLKMSDNSYIFNPSPDLELEKDFKLFALGNTEQINKLKQVLRHGM